MLRFFCTKAFNYQCFINSLRFITCNTIYKSSWISYIIWYIFNQLPAVNILIGIVLNSASGPYSQQSNQSVEDGGGGSERWHALQWRVWCILKLVSQTCTCTMPSLAHPLWISSTYSGERFLIIMTVLLNFPTKSWWVERARSRWEGSNRSRWEGRDL